VEISIANRLAGYKKALRRLEIDVTRCQDDCGGREAWKIKRVVDKFTRGSNRSEFSLPIKIRYGRESYQTSGTRTARVRKIENGVVISVRSARENFDFTYLVRGDSWKHGIIKRVTRYSLDFTRLEDRSYVINPHRIVLGTIEHLKNRGECLELSPWAENSCRLRISPQEPSIN